MIIFEDEPGWGKLLDEFRKTDIYKKSNGKHLSEDFEEWIKDKIPVIEPF